MLINVLHTEEFKTKMHWIYKIISPEPTQKPALHRSKLMFWTWYDWSVVMALVFLSVMETICIFIRPVVGSCP